MEEVAKTHSERLKFLDPELESTNTRIEVLETICKANELKINSLSKLRDMRKEIVKINDRSSHTEKHHTRQGNYPVHPLQQLFFSLRLLKYLSFYFGDNDIYEDGST